MTDTVASEFPFVESLPKRAKSRFQRAWDVVEELTQKQAEVGEFVPASLVAKVLQCSRQNVFNLAERGSLEPVRVDGHFFITKRSLVAYAETERLQGRPLKSMNYREALRAAWENAHGK